MQQRMQECDWRIQKLLTAPDKNSVFTVLNLNFARLQDVMYVLFILVQIYLSK